MLLLVFGSVARALPLAGVSLLCARLSFCGSRTSWKVVSCMVLLVFGSVARALPLTRVSPFVLVFRFAEVGRLGRSSHARCCWFLAPSRVHCL